MKRVLILSALLLAGIGENAGHAADKPPVQKKPPTPEQAGEQLVKVRAFAFGGVGFAGTISEGERAWRIILTSPDALKLFRSTLSTGTTEAKLYALCGIRQLDKPSFPALAKPVLDANPQVTTMAGCSLTHEPAASVIQRIAAGQYDQHFKQPHQ